MPTYDYAYIIIYTSSDSLSQSFVFLSLRNVDFTRNARTSELHIILQLIMSCW
jgi:hypothetical protein